ncbi:GNAT family N-acetyltransferase [Flagellimonas abyssi]|uniref:N-acetyltransferase n=1 Tax=Flagellimonas abyssi TaxID=2864871 RepID=A0ABS7EQ83_9FLAO|nr:GNAT family N-acetyltransferase [Allomuricauda abyssi]MBC70737.1 GNAT family N-acetyltransferase [Allomuricauda sp.]MBW8199219.1 N-acetyltransferase [Allomuricauda abyssi]
MEKQYQLVDNESAKRFQFELDNGDIAKIEYIKAKEKIYLTHTEVPPGHEGQGIGSELIKQTLEHIKKEDWTLIPLCPFVAKYLKEHPEWKTLVLKGINIE